MSAWCAECGCPFKYCKHGNPNQDKEGLLEHLKTLSLNQDKEIKLLKSKLRKIEITIIGTISLLQRQIDEQRDDPKLLKARIQLLDALVEKKKR